MKNLTITFLCFAICLQFSFAQNTFPSSGNVGIGTTSPANLFSVFAPTAAFNVNFYSPAVNTGDVNGLKFFTGYSIAENKWVGIAAVSESLYSNTSGLAFYTGNSERLRISNGGNIGIGTAGPPSALSVTPAAFGYGLTNQASNLLAGTLSGLNSSAGSYLYPFEFQHGNSGGNVDRLQFTPYRRVAGTTWPGTAYRLQFAVDNSFTDGSKAFVEVGASDPSFGGGGFISFGTAGADRLSINNSGNVLIGKTTQVNTGYILDVNGNVRANQVVINTTGADFVFAPNYRLNSLANVKKYIDKNHHLPEIASAKEMQTNGLNVGENQTKLLQKVEELTLYLIEKDKQLNEQKNKLNNQQKTNDTQQQEIDELKRQMAQLLKRSK